MKTFLKKLLVGFIGLITALFLFEIGLRIYGYIYRYPYEQHKKEKAREKGKYTIICVGDSYTEGAHVALNQNYPSVLQEILDEQYGDGCFTVINHGMSAQNSNILVKYITDKIFIEEKSDILIFMAGANNTVHKIAEDNKKYIWEKLHIWRFVKWVLYEFEKKKSV